MSQEKKHYKIGLTASIGDAYQSIWGSGITQNILFLYQLYSQSTICENIYIVDFVQDDITPERELVIANKTYKMINKHQAVQILDVMIEVGTQIWTDIGKAFQDRGGKLVSLRCGNPFIDEIMGIFGDRQPLIPMNFIHYDEIWVLPHYAKNSGPMLQTLFHTNVKSVNYIWEPEFVDFLVNERGIEFDYAKQNANKNHEKKSKKIAICEPNLNPTKTFHIPLLIAEELYCQKPEMVEHIYCMNTWRCHDNPSAMHFVNRLSLFRDGKMTFENRVDLPQVLKNIADTILSHHWENDLNYLYLDTVYGNYPLIHNSEMLKDIGYYYELFNVQQGAQVLKDVILHHDTSLDDYAKRAKKAFARHSIYNQDNIAHYDNLIIELCGQNQNQYNYQDTGV